MESRLWRMAQALGSVPTFSLRSFQYKTQAHTPFITLFNTVAYFWLSKGELFEETVLKRSTWLKTKTTHSSFSLIQLQDSAFRQVKEVKPITGRMLMKCEIQFTLSLGPYSEMSEQLGKHVFIAATQDISCNYYGYWANFIAMLLNNLQSLHSHQTHVR